MPSVFKNFICLEGIDGSGKSTQIVALENLFKSKGLEVLKIREPGGTEISEAVRKILLDPEHKGKMSDITELLLYNAARSQLLHEVVKPALKKGVAVLADRFAYSTLAYQGYGRGLNIDMIKNLLNITCGDFFPNKTFILDIEISLSRERQQKDKNRSKADRIEQEENEFFERVAHGYRTIARENSGNCILLNAANSPEDIFKLIVNHLNS
ncbi:MAG: dTMP kinase [Candidatus Fibromonas sp.]|jgi:dTMP kinase|nr:dTMP kinase [Candidatus Fibromonas sp.]